MAGLTRTMLAGMGIEDANIQRIIEVHTEVTSSLKDALDAANKKALNAEQLTKKLEAAEAELETLKKEDYKSKYESEKKAGEKLKKEYEDYKADQSNKAIRAAKEAAFKDILKDANIPERHHAKIIKYSDIDSIEIDEKGKAKNAKELLKSVKEEWDDHAETVTIKGTDTPNPPASSGGKSFKTKDEIMQIEDPGERQAAMKEAIVNGSDEFHI